MKKLATYDTIKKIVKYMKGNFIRTSDPIFRQPSTAYAVGDVVYVKGAGVKYYLLCVTAGTTAETDIDMTGVADGSSITDGTVTWTIRKLTTVKIPNASSTVAGIMKLYSSKGANTDGAMTQQAITNELGNLESLIGSGGDGVPLGAILPLAHNSTIPAGYLLCDGAAVSRTMYPDLFSVIGTTYGAGNGSTTFNLPNLTNRFIEGSLTAGTVKNAGLPNIRGSIDASSGSANYQSFGDTRKQYTKESGALAGIYKNQTGVSGEGGGTTLCGITIDASKSNSIYGASNTVQPNALTCRYIVKYK